MVIEKYVKSLFFPPRTPVGARYGITSAYQNPYPRGRSIRSRPRKFRFKGNKRRRVRRKIKRNKGRKNKTLRLGSGKIPIRARYTFKTCYNLTPIHTAGTERGIEIGNVRMNNLLDPVGTSKEAPYAQNLGALYDSYVINRAAAVCTAYGNQIDTSAGKLGHRFAVVAQVNTDATAWTKFANTDTLDDICDVPRVKIVKGLKNTQFGEKTQKTCSYKTSMASIYRRPTQHIYDESVFWGGLVACASPTAPASTAYIHFYLWHIPDTVMPTILNGEIDVTLQAFHFAKLFVRERAIAN